MITLLGKLLGKIPITNEYWKDLKLCRSMFCNNMKKDRGVKCVKTQTRK